MAERSPLAQKMIDLLGAEQADRKLIMHLNQPGHHRSAYEYTGPAGKLTFIREGPHVELQWGEDLFAHFEARDNAWVLIETNEPAG